MRCPPILVTAVAILVLAAGPGVAAPLPQPKPPETASPEPPSTGTPPIEAAPGELPQPRPVDSDTTGRPPSDPGKARRSPGGTADRNPDERPGTAAPPDERRVPELTEDRLDRATRDPAPERAPPRPPAPTPAEACLERLRRLGVVFSPHDPVEEGGCRIEAPVTVTVLPGGIAVGPETLLGCFAAEALARWMTEVVRPEAEAHLHAKPSGLAHASAYVCRRRNGASSGKMSEHAFGNAVDIASIAFTGHDPVAAPPGKNEPPEVAAFRQAVRRGACAYFTTVLGPGSDAAHADHLHLDLAERHSGSRLCQ